MSFARQLGLLTTGNDVIGVGRRLRDKNVKSWRRICDDRAEQANRLHEQSLTHAQPSPDWKRACIAFIIFKLCISVTSSPPNNVDASFSLQCTAFAHLVSSQKVDTKKIQARAVRAAALVHPAELSAASRALVASPWHRGLEPRSTR